MESIDINNSDIFNMREGVFTEEKENISSFRPIADIEIRRSDETGKFYLKFIEWMSGWNEGLWQKQEVPEDVVRLILSFCYPEHISQCMTKELGKKAKHEHDELR